MPPDLQLYHWAPVDRRASIRRRGLVPGSRPARRGSEPMPYVCASPDPAAAWMLSVAVLGARGSQWDLWQLRLDDQDVVLRDDEPAEHRVYDVVPPRDLWLVGTRAVPERGRRW